MKWYVSYFARGAYHYKIVSADSAEQAIRRARVKDINDLKIITNDEQQARENPSCYTFVEA